MPVIAKPDAQLWKMLGVDVEEEKKKSKISAETAKPAAEDSSAEETAAEEIPDQPKKWARKGIG